MLDAHSDKAKTLIHSIALRVGSNDFMKIAEHVVESEVPVSVLDYADTENRLYPCHTKEATLVNFTYFVDQISAYPREKAEKITNKFNEKIAFWNLEDTVEEIISSLNRSHPVKYAMEIGEHKLYPYADAKSLEKTATTFYNNKHKYPYEVRNKTAKHILKVAGKLSAKLSNDVVRYLKKAAGWAEADVEGMVAIVRNRAHDTKHRKIASALEEIASTLPHFDDNLSSRFDTEKVAAFITAVEAYDRATRISDDYVSLGLPEEKAYSDIDLTKVAEELKNTVKLTNGVEVEVTEDLVNKIAAADPSLGKDIAGSVDKAVDILPTLPRPDADYIVEACL